MTVPNQIVRRAIRLLALFVLIVAAPHQASAQDWSQTFAPNLGTQDEFQLTGASGVVSTFSVPVRGYVGPYSARLTSDPTKGSFSVFCIDFLNSIRVNDIWTANISTVVAGGLDATRLGMAGVTDAVVRYQKAIWLATQFAANQTRAQWTGIHDAIWSLVNPGDGTFLTTDGTGAYWAGEVEAAFASGAPTDVDYASWRVLTDVNANGRLEGKQEFLVRVVTSESTSTLVLAFGMGVLWIVGRRRRRDDRRRSGGGLSAAY